MILHVEKEYCHSRHGGTVTLYGTIDLPPDEARQFRKDMQERKISSLDHRIKWQEDEDYDEDDEHWVYVDHSFGFTLRFSPLIQSTILESKMQVAQDTRKRFSYHKDGGWYWHNRSDGENEERGLYEEHGPHDTFYECLCDAVEPYFEYEGLTAPELQEILESRGLSWAEITETDPEGVDPANEIECEMVREYLRQHN